MVRCRTNGVHDAANDIVECKGAERCGIGCVGVIIIALDPAMIGRNAQRSVPVLTKELGALKRGDTTHVLSTGVEWVADDDDVIDIEAVEEGLSGS